MAIFSQLHFPAFELAENAKIAIARSSFGQIERIIKTNLGAVFCVLAFVVWVDLDDSG